MSKSKKIRDRILAGNADANIDFDDLCWLLQEYGFDLRVKGSHHIFTRNDVAEILNLQTKGSKTKPYQVKQVRNLIVDYDLGDKNE
ncbi:MAG: type II toxin-antitoxin system HicA family toxin [Pyrinomonadaceae bacterium]|nr:type II toxin-antitoxin system HicA family toxin [Pyrinomonadaceae bacterium]